MTGSTRWMDTLTFIFSAAILIAVAAWTLNGQFIPGLLANDRSITWQLIRSTGITAYILITVSTLWGLKLSGKFVKEWSPGTLSVLLHNSVSWLGIGFAALHAILLLFDEYVTYRPVEIIIPFLGPYRPVAVGLGITSFWILLLVALSFAVKHRLGYHRWKKLHYASYAAFFMVTVHALFAGTDAEKLGFKLFLGLAVFLVVILTGYRIGVSKTKIRPARKQ